MHAHNVSAAGQFKLSYNAGCRAFDRGDYREAETRLLAAVVKAERFGPTDPRLACGLSRLAWTYTRLGRHDLAEPLHQRVLAMRTAVIGEKSPKLAESLNGLAAAARARRDVPAFTALVARAAELQSPSSAEPADPATLVETFRLMAAQAAALGGSEMAESLLFMALQVCRRFLGPASPVTADTLGALGRQYYDTGRIRQALDCLESAAASRGLRSHQDHPALADILENLAAVYQEQHNLPDARMLLEEVLRIREKAFGPDHPELMAPLNDLAMVHQDLGNGDDAERLLQRAMLLVEKHPQPSQETAPVLLNYATMLARQGRFEQAEPLSRRTATVCRAAFGPEDQRTVDAHRTLAVCCFGVGKVDEADSLLRQMIEIVERHPEPGSAGLREMLGCRATVLQRAGRDAEAAECRARAAACPSPGTRAADKSDSGT